MPREIRPANVRKVVFETDSRTELNGLLIDNQVRLGSFEPLQAGLHVLFESAVIGDLWITTIGTRTGYCLKREESTAERLEILFAENGLVRVTVDGEEHDIGEFEAHLSLGRRLHTMETQAFTSQTVISAPINRYSRSIPIAESDPLSYLRRLAPILSNEHLVVRAIRGIATILQAPGEKHSPFSAVPRSAAILKEALYQALVCDWPLEKGVQKSKGPVPRYVRRALEWIELHLGEKISLCDIAAAAGTSPRTLQILFRNQVGVGPMQFVGKERMRRVHDDLIDIDNHDTIAAIAHRHGLIHLSEFGRRYKQEYGKTPSEARRQAKLRR